MVNTSPSGGFAPNEWRGPRDSVAYYRVLEPAWFLPVKPVLPGLQVRDVDTLHYACLRLQAEVPSM
jgi:hypothetical protein